MALRCMQAVRAEQENKQREYDSSQVTRPPVAMLKIDISIGSSHLPCKQSQRNNQYSREAQQLQTQLAFRDRELAEVETELYVDCVRGLQKWMMSSMYTVHIAVNEGSEHLKTISSRTS